MIVKIIGKIADTDFFALGEIEMKSEFGANTQARREAIARPKLRAGAMLLGADARRQQELERRQPGPASSRINKSRISGAACGNSSHSHISRLRYNDLIAGVRSRKELLPSGRKWELRKGAPRTA